MRKTIFFLLATTPVLAQDVSPSFEDFDINIPEGVKAHFQVKAKYDITDNGEFSTPGVRHQKMRFGEGEASIAYIFPVNRCHTFSVSLGYQNTLVDWDENPQFSQEFFHDGFLSIGAKTTSIPCWDFQAEAAFYVDLELWERRSFLFYLTGWGRYRFNHYTGINVGFISRSGIRQERVWPILGFDIQWSEAWKVNLVYPINLSIAYQVTPRWSSYVGARIVNTRHRLDHSEPNPNGIFQYRNWGCEVGVNYGCDPIYQINVHLGYFTHGDLKVSDFHDHNAIHYKLDPTPYLGGAAFVRF